MSKSSLPKGAVEFDPHHVPALAAGSYGLTISQDLSLQRDDTVTESGTLIPEITHRFAVYGERFTLKPGEIDKVFPPRGSSGEYDNVLPHAVIKRRTLPWERSPFADGDRHIHASRDGVDADVAPWLALLVLSADELAQCPQGQSRTAPGYRAASVTVAELFPAERLQAEGRSNTKALPTDTFSYFSNFVAVNATENASGSTKLAKELGSAKAPKEFHTNKLDEWEKLTDQLRVVDLPLELFCKIAPTLDDLPWLAHARKRKIPGANPEETDFAVIVAGRLPAPAVTSTVHLVSLERLGAILPDASGQLSEKIPEGVNYIRLASLMSWDFQSQNKPLGFKQILERLNTEHLRSAQLRIPAQVELSASKIAAVSSSDISSELKDALTAMMAEHQEHIYELDDFLTKLSKHLRIADFFSKTEDLSRLVSSLTPNLPQFEADALSRGYTPLPHHTRYGDTLLSWYRGPLAPYPPNISLPLPANSADALAGYDPTTCMFDVSYSTAWQIGRLAALASGGFSKDFYFWRRSISHKTAANLDAQHAGIPVSRDAVKDLLRNVVSSALSQKEGRDET